MTNIQFPPTGSGNLTITVVDNNGSATNVLEASQPFTIEAVWTIDTESARVLGGQWELSAYVESFGPGLDAQVGPTRVKALDGSETYSDAIVVPPNTFPDNPAAPSPGVYKVIVVLLLRNNNRVTDVAAIAEGPLVRIG
jgi:hypothetical protein